MSKIYIDVSEMVRLPYVSGIQRVVIEVLKVWLATSPDQVCVMVFDHPKREYLILDGAWFLSAVGDPRRMKQRMRHVIEQKCISDFGTADIFFDMDSSWIGSLKRSWLLPILKQQGVRIAVQIYDIIPVTHPEYCHAYTVLTFLEHLGAYLSYAELMIANAQATIDTIKTLTEEAGVRMPETAVVPLGCNFSGKQDHSEKQRVIRDSVGRIPENGKYILMVGTIEPRKNHAYVLDAFEKSLFENGLNLVYAGRIGWNMADFAERIRLHPQIGKRFFHISDGSDDEIAFLYEKAFAVVFPSLDEGFGLPIIEAFLHGTPVLASDIPVLREVGKENCIYFDVSDPESFVKQTLDLVSNEQQYRDLKERISSYRPFTWKESAERMWEAINVLNI